MTDKQPEKKEERKPEKKKEKSSGWGAPSAGTEDYNLNPPGTR